MRAIVINCSAPHYNLGAHKCHDWLLSQGYESHYYDGDPGMWELDADLVALSCIFSWHAPIARMIALRMKDRAEVWAGGPGLFALASWWRKETGLDVVRGLDPRFDKQRGQYKMVFASRGCPVACSFCVAHLIEGREQTLDPEFVPAPILCDNNLSALSEDSQQYIIDRYLAFNQPLLDANSGFEPRTFDENTYRRWKPLLRGAWRFALDETRELEDVRRMMLQTSLQDESPKRKQVYCLIGNEPIEACYARACTIIEWKGEPFCQFVLPLNWLGDPAKLHPRFDWTYQLGKDFMRYFNRHLWRSFPIWEYKPRRDEPPPFAFLCSSYLPNMENKTMKEPAHSQTNVPDDDKFLAVTYLTVEDVERRLQLGRTTIYQLMKREGLPTEHFGRTVRIPLLAFQEWLAKRQQAGVIDAASRWRPPHSQPAGRQSPPVSRRSAGERRR